MNVLFVCSGNTCRSPLAEALASRLAAERGVSGVSFSSAGTGALNGGGASDAAILVGLEQGIDLSGHRTRALTPALVAEADLVLVMAPHHLDAVRAIADEIGDPAPADDKVQLLDQFASGGETADAINDPFGGSLDAYRQTVAELEERIARVLDRLSS